MAKLESQKAPISQPTTRRSESSVAAAIAQVKAIWALVTESMKPEGVTTTTNITRPLPPQQLEGSSFSRFNI